MKDNWRRAPFAQVGPGKTPREEVQETVSRLEHATDQNLSIAGLWSPELNVPHLVLTAEGRRPIKLPWSWLAVLQEDGRDALQCFGRFQAGQRQQLQSHFPVRQEVSEPAWELLRQMMQALPLNIPTDASPEALLELSCVVDYLRLSHLLSAMHARLCQLMDFPLWRLIDAGVSLRAVTSLSEEGMAGVAKHYYGALQRMLRKRDDVGTAALLQSHLLWISEGGEPMDVAAAVQAGLGIHAPSLGALVPVWLKRAASALEPVICCSVLPLVLSLDSAARVHVATMALAYLSCDSGLDPGLRGLQAAPDASRGHAIQRMLQDGAADASHALFVRTPKEGRAIGVSSAAIAVLGLFQQRAPYSVPLEGADDETVDTFASLLRGEIEGHPIGALTRLANQFIATRFAHLLSRAIGSHRGAIPDRLPPETLVHWVEAFELGGCTDAADEAVRSLFDRGFPAERTLKMLPSAALAPIVRYLRSVGMPEPSLAEAVMSRWPADDPCYSARVVGYMSRETDMADLLGFGTKRLPMASAIPLMIASIARSVGRHRSAQVSPVMEIPVRAEDDATVLSLGEQYRRVGPFVTQRLELPLCYVSIQVLPEGIELDVDTDSDESDAFVLIVEAHGATAPQVRSLHWLDNWILRVPVDWGDDWGLGPAPMLCDEPDLRLRVVPADRLAQGLGVSKGWAHVGSHRDGTVSMPPRNSGAARHRPSRLPEAPW